MNEHDPNNFSIFWQGYPRKVAKAVAERSWKKLNPTPDILQIILKDIEARKTSDEWTKNEGSFIPYPATYLNQERWKDEPVEVSTAKHKARYYTAFETHKRPFISLTDQEIIDRVAQDPVHYVKGMLSMGKHLRPLNPGFYERLRGIIVDLAGRNKIKEIQDDFKKDQTYLSAGYKAFK